MPRPPVEFRILPARDMDPQHVAAREEMRREFAFCRSTRMKPKPHDMIRAHRSGMPMSEISKLSGADVNAVRHAIMTSWGDSR